MESISHKSLPDMHGDLTRHPAHTLDENRTDCVQCDRRNGEDAMVQCDVCQMWWHFSCAGVTDSIKDRSWSCPKCHANDLCSSVSVSRHSRTSNSSVKSERVNLQLEKLAELHAMKEKFIEEKYKLLESQLESERDHESVRSKRSRVSKQTSLAKVAMWVNECAEQKDDNVPVVTDAGCLLPPAPSNQTKQNAATGSCIPTQVELPDKENQQSPLKHPSMPTSAVNPTMDDSKTDPNPDKDATRHAVFSKNTGNVPLAQSTPAKVPFFEQQAIVTASSMYPRAEEVANLVIAPSAMPVHTYKSVQSAPEPATYSFSSSV